MSQQKNQLFQNLMSGINDRFSLDSKDMTGVEWMTANTTLDRKPFSTTRYPFQTQILNDMHLNLCCIKPSQVGLALSLDTPILTTRGWKTMETLKVGDKVYDEQGHETVVTYKSPVWKHRDCYELTLDTGENITSDGSHRWFVESYKAFNKEGLYGKTGRIPKNSDFNMSGVISTEKMFPIYKQGNRNIFSIPCTKPLNYSESKLPVDPYLLGLWLGDGNRTNDQIVCDFKDFEVFSELFPEVVYYTDKRNGVVSFRVVGVTPAKFKLAGVYKNKHLPDVYLKSSISQRWELLRGLMDSDGSITKKGRCSFHNTNPSLIEGVKELLHSLGLKTRTRWRKPRKGVLKSGHIIKGTKEIAEVSFVTYSDKPCFKLPRKRERLIRRESGRDTESGRRRIIDIRKVESVPTQCITVDSPNHLFLAGKGLIPTHNTEGQIRKALAFLMRNQGTSLIYTLPNEAMYTRISDARIRPIVQTDKVFNGPTVMKPIRRKDLMEIGRSKLYIAAAIESAATSIDADAVFVDEIDLSDQKMIALLNSRMQNSDWKMKQQFSTPTFPAYGVHQTYELSDKHVFLRKCGACGHHNEPAFNRNFVHVGGLPHDVDLLTDIEAVHIPHIDFKDCYVKCEKCHSPLDMKDYSLTEWVATHPSITEYRGYKVSPFSTDRLPPEYIIKQLIQYKGKEFVRGFYNTTLGEPYSDGTMQISHELIAHAFKDVSPLLPSIGSDRPVWIGIDMGQICNIILGTGTNKNNMQPFSFRTVPVRDLVKEVKQIMKDYNLVGGLIDRQPYTPKSEEIMAISNGKIVPAQYSNRNSAKLNDFKELEYYQLDRTGSLDFVHTRMKRMDMKFEGYSTYKSTLEVHLRDMVREDVDEKAAVWKKLTNRDHFFHSLGYLLAAPEAKELVEIKLKEDKRESIIIAGAQLGDKDPHDHLIGFGGGKTVDRIVSSRVLN